MAHGSLGDVSGRGRVHETVHVAAPGYVPVLAELAGQIAAGGTEGQHAAARVEMVEGLFLVLRAIWGK
jgi:hypothetical protein